MKTDSSQRPNILAFATQGSGSGDEQRLRTLLSRFEARFYPFDRNHKASNLRRLLSLMRQERPDLVVIEGTGLFGGLAVILGSILYGIPYVVSSGDAVGPYLARKQPLLGPLFHWYEKALCRRATGFVGWTPYLAGRAMTFGTKYAMTAAGWAPFVRDEEGAGRARKLIRDKLGIPDTSIVAGLVGSLNWNSRVGYCYGYELVKALCLLPRNDLRVLIVGDGSGRPILEHLAGEEAGKRVLFTGRVSREQVPAYLAAMDLASLPQSVDQVGSFRYTTKLSEYMAAGLPVITGAIPASYDLGGDWMLRISGDAPWDDGYIRHLAQTLDRITPDEIRQLAAKVPKQHPSFDRDSQIQRFSEFIADIMQDRLKQTARKEQPVHDFRTYSHLSQTE